MISRDFEIKGGYMGKVLRIDLSSGIIKEEELDAEKVALYLGGAGLGARYLIDEVPPYVGAFDPENRLIFFAGPLSGTSVPGSSTYTVTTKGVMTNLITTSQANGWFAARMKFAGYDGIIIQGAAAKLVYVVINEGTVEICDASDLKGMDIRETEGYLKEKLNLPRASVASIGSAGENLVKFANIGNDYGHFASTNGVGAVMGSKNLKAIVVNGTKRVPIYDLEKFRECAKAWQMETQKTIMGSTVSAVGTIGFFSPAAITGWLPVKNLTTTIYEEHPKFNGDYVRTIVKSKRTPCHACPLHHCCRLQLQSEPYLGLETDEPEYEGLAAFGALIGNTDFNKTIKLCDMVDRLGMDLKECSFAIALAIECYEDGIITKEDTDGLELTWGNADEVIKLMPKIANREGFGRILAEGVYRMAQELGPEADRRAVYTHKGIAPHVHDPRGMWGYLISQAVSNFGSIEGMAPAELLPSPDLGLNEPVPMFVDPMGLVEAQCEMAKKGGFVESIGVCHFVCVELSRMVEALNALLGTNWSTKDVLEMGHRQITLLKLFNIKHGWTRDMDTISQRLLEACPDGPNAGISIEDSLEPMIKKWYEVMGWDEDGHPKTETLKKLNMEEFLE